MRRPLLHQIALFARQRYVPIFWIGGLLVATSLFLATRIRFDTDVMALLPQNEPIVDSYREALTEFGSIDYLLLAVRVPEGAVLDPFQVYVDALAERLETVELLDEVEYRLGNREELFRTFLPEALLFLDREGLESLAEKVTDESLEARARELRRLVTTPQSLALKQLIQLDPYGLWELFLDRLVTTRGGLSLDWMSGYLLSKDHRMLLILGKPTRPPQDVDFAKELIARVEAEIAAVAAEWPELIGPDPPPVPEVAIGGRHLIGITDAKLIQSDVIANLATSLLGVMVLFLFAFRRLGPLVYAVVPLMTGLIVTFGASALGFGGVLSAATSGTAALLIGLGIDFVIVSYGRYVEERQQGADLTSALMTMSGSSGRAVVVGAVTSAATFYSFGVTDFAGLFQMGLLTGTGILFCMIAVVVLLPAMLAWHEDHHTRRQRMPRHFLHAFGSDHVIAASYRYPVPVLLVGLLLTVVAGISASRLEFVDSIQAMRPKGNEAVAIRDEIATRFGAGFEQMMWIVEGESPDEVLALAERASGRAADLVRRGVLTGYDGISSLLPSAERQQAALEWLAEASRDRMSLERIRSTFVSALEAQGLRPQPFVDGMELFGSAVSRTQPLRLADVQQTPEAARFLRRYLREDEDGWTSVVYLYPPPRQWRREPPPDVLAAASELGEASQVTGANVVSRFLRERVFEDAYLAGALGFVIVAILLWLDYRRLRDTLISLAPLTVGILWMLGAMAALDIAMNFMNIFVSTMIIGIGVDYGVHMIHRFRERQAGSDDELFAGLVETGKAIVLAALSTIVGFGSLSRSHYPGLSSMGLVAIMGAVATCVVAITLLPAYLSLLRRRNQ